MTGGVDARVHTRESFSLSKTAISTSTITGIRKSSWESGAETGD